MTFSSKAMPPVDLEEFARALVAAGVATDDELRAVRAQLAARGAVNVPALASELAARGKLSAEQAAILERGELPTLVLGEYLILQRLGAGGMGAVYRALHRKMAREVALKVVRGERMDDREAVDRFTREIRAAARLSHPHIVTAFDAGEAGGLHYLVMELLDGEDLHSRLRRGGPLGVGHAVGYVVQAAQGLARAHEVGIIHRDIKPANLFVDRQGTVKVLDLGLARALVSGPVSDDGYRTQTGQIMGTVDFMSPEQAVSTRNVDARTDIYSLGCTLYVLLTGRAPYDGDSVLAKVIAHREQPPPRLREDRRDVPAGLEAVFQRMVAKQPADRLASMSAVIDALSPFVSQQLKPALPETIELATGTTRHGTTRVGERQSGPRPTVWLAGLGIAAVCLLALAWMWLGGSAPNPPSAMPRGVLPPQVAAQTPPEAARDTSPKVVSPEVSPTTVSPTPVPPTPLPGGTATPDKTTASKYRLAHERTMRPEMHTLRLVFLPDSKTLAAVGGHFYQPEKPGSVQLWNVETGLISERLKGHTQNVRALALSADGKRLATGTGDMNQPVASEIKLWQADADGRFSLLREWAGHTGGQGAMAFLPGDQLLVTGPARPDVDDSLRVWKLADGSLDFVFENPAKAGVAQLVLSRDKSLVAAARGNESVVLWDLKTRHAVQTLDKHLGSVADMAFDGQGRLLATTCQHRAGAPAELTIWSDWLGKPARRDIRITPEPGGPVFVDQCCVAVSPTTPVLVTGGGDARIRLWDLSGNILDEQPIEEEWLWTLCFSPDGKWLASGSSDTIRLWRVVGETP